MYHILYVDDEPGLLEITKIFLEGGGQITVDTRTSAKSALPLVLNGNYDAVVSDYQMPETDGIQFLKTVRGSGCTLPFILFTGKGREEIAIQALNEGADFYLQKGGEPVSQFTELSTKIRYAVNRKRAEAALRTSEEKYRRFVETSIEGIWSMDAGFVTTFVNRKMADMLGYSVEEMMGKTITVFMDPDELADNAKKLEDRRQGRNDYYERKFRRKDGSIRWFGVSATSLKNPDGSFAGSFAMLTDITERRQAEEALKQKNEELGAAYEQITASEEELRQNLDELAESQKALKKSESKYRSLFNNAILGIFRSTPDGQLLDVNPAFARLAGYALPREMIEKVPDIRQIYVRPEDRREFQEILERDGEIRGFEAEIRRPDTVSVWISINAKTVRSKQDGRIISFDGTIEDITARKSAEIELLRRNEELQASHEEITATEEELRQNLSELAGQENDLRRKTAESENRHRLIEALLDTTPVGIFMVEVPSGKPIMANREAVRLLGRGILPDVNGETLSQVYEAYQLGTGERYPTREMPIFRGMLGETSHVEDMVIVRPDGTRVRLEVFGNPVRDFEGRIIASLVSFLDITGRGWT